MWKKTRMLIWGKTYPEFSAKYYETVCTGAVHGESGRLIRIYPVTLRYLDSQFKTYQWIDARIERNASGARPESFKIKQNTIVPGKHIDAESKDGWEERAKWTLRPESIFASVEALQRAQAAEGTSLGSSGPSASTGSTRTSGRMTRRMSGRRSARSRSRRRICSWTPRRRCRIWSSSGWTTG
jgi:hypothetical protein